MRLSTVLCFNVASFLVGFFFNLVRFHRNLTRPIFPQLIAFWKGFLPGYFREIQVGERLSIMMLVWCWVPADTIVARESQSRPRLVKDCYNFARWMVLTKTKKTTAGWLSLVSGHWWRLCRSRFIISFTSMSSSDEEQWNKGLCFFRGKGDDTNQLGDKNLAVSGLTYYPVIWGLFHKPWNTDPTIRRPGFNGK